MMFCGGAEWRGWWTLHVPETPAHNFRKAGCAKIIHVFFHQTVDPRISERISKTKKQRFCSRGMHDAYRHAYHFIFIGFGCWIFIGVIGLGRRLDRSPRVIRLFWLFALSASIFNAFGCGYVVCSYDFYGTEVAVLTSAL